MRNTTLDLFKAVSICAVIVIHTHPFGVYGVLSRTGMEIFLNQLCRYAVPFFFLVTGYFLGKNPPITLAFLWSRSKRWLYLFFIWSALYIIISTDVGQIAQHGYIHLVYWKLYYCSLRPGAVVFSGSATHLWYLPSLVCSTLFVWFVRQLNRHVAIPFCAVLYIVGVLGGAYKNTALGLPIPFDTKYGPIMGSFFIAIGWELASISHVKSHKAFKIALLGLLLHMVELRFLHTLDASLDLTSVDFLFSTCLFSLGIILWALSLPQVQVSVFTRIGQQTLGIYLCHPLFLEFLRPVREWNSIVINSLLIPVVVLSLAIVLTQFAYRNPRTRYLFS